MRRTGRLSPDGIAIIVLVMLWALFFWRVLTPIEADRASFKQGDFSGQFVAFGAYQYERLTAGEVPLWNPYNNSGLPFVADTQAAAFYPPRLLTVGLARLAGGWSYHALQLEALAHILGYTVVMYALVRRLTGSVWGGVTAAIVGGYGGYLGGYPPLQLALLEAGVWLPMVILGLHGAVKTDGIDYGVLSLAGLALGLSWLAGHPQTAWFLTYLGVAYFVFRLWEQGQFGWRRLVQGVVFFGGITVGVTAVTLFPGAEYLAQTARSGMGYAGKTNGFPLQDVVQMMYPGVVSLFSPLYVGLTGVGLVGLAISRANRAVWFWLGVVAVGLMWSFGGNTAFFPAIYNALPGLRFFRGQERAAFYVAHGLAILAGYGAALAWSADLSRAARLVVGWALRITGVIFGAGVLLWVGFPADYGAAIGALAFAPMVLIGLWAALRLAPAGSVALRVAVIGLLVFELFSVTMDAASNYDDVPPVDQVAMTAPPLVAPVMPTAGRVVRVDGFRGLTANYGSLYGVYDARGISPLFLDGLYQLQQPPFATPAAFEINPVFWELNAVEYVYSGWEDLPIAGEVIASGADQYGAVNLHELADPRPFAHLVYAADVVDSDEFARALLAAPAYNPRESVILRVPPSVDLPDGPPDGGTATVTQFAPEQFTVTVDTPDNAILTLAHPDYPGWQATRNGEPARILRAYGGFSAVEIPAGEHVIMLSYDPVSFRVGAGLSLLTWVGLGVFGLIKLVIGRRQNADN